MRITFLGTGGGRFTTISQRRMTGGFRIDDFNGKNYHVDPGPGGLVRSYQFGLDPKKLDGVFVSHAHTDHYVDAEVLIESMTRGMTKEHGIIMGSRSVFEGFKQWGPCVSKYHKTNSENLILGPNKTKVLDNMTIKGTKTVHGDPTCVGFQMEHDGFKLSYTADTKLFDKLSDYHKGANILIASVIRPGSSAIKGHMCSNNFAELINEVKPDLAIMTHFGLKMLNMNPVVEAKQISSKTGVKTIAAFDGMSLEINTSNPTKSKFISLKDNNARQFIQQENNSFQKVISRQENNADKKLISYTRDFIER
ncbi:MBL fold metallo-hydrolase [Methanobrevibacter sp. OttesenSCG-928-K11]|nr:MBL fold metallo-hydrolase [Methanobrevibacter sp. OttesenSCG-928-K11]MDL2270879.1 MBL fold metallo-hydrolase [Methanobrevibacter sp. OttesenSCG-928-I08]